MRWESVHVNARARETAEGKKSSGRTGGIWGPGKRWGHTVNAVRGGKFLYVFAGYGVDNSQTNDVHVFDTVKQTWSKPMMKGTPPSPRDSHSCTTVGNRLFVFGGTDGSNPLKDLHVLDTSSNTWIVPAVTGEGPDAREGHSAALVDKRLFIFGGCGKSKETHQEVYYNDLYILDTERLIWEHALTSGAPPCPRDSHTCSSWNKKIIVLGGEDSSDCYLSDVHMLDADTLVWKQINTSGQMLAPRAGHTTVGLGSYLFVFGGFTDSRNLYDDLHVLNVDTSTWSRVVTLNQGPSARFSVAGDCLDEHRGIIVFTGGCNKSLEALDDMYYFHIDMSKVIGPSKILLEKSNVRGVLKKCGENNLPAEGPVRNSDKKMVGSTSDCPYLVLPQAGYTLGQFHGGIEKQVSTSGNSSSTIKVPFEAAVTDETEFGYAVEAVVDGKILHGMLFSFTASGCYNQDYPTYSNKRRVRRKTGAELNKHQPFCSELMTVQNIKTSDQGLLVGAYGQESRSQASPMELVLPAMPESTTSSAAYQPITVVRDSEPPLLSPRDLEYLKVEPSKRKAADMMNNMAMHLKSGLDKLKPLTPFENWKYDSENRVEPLNPSEVQRNDEIGDGTQQNDDEFSDMDAEGPGSQEQEKSEIARP